MLWGMQSPRIHRWKLPIDVDSANERMVKACADEATEDLGSEAEWRPESPGSSMTVV